MSEYQYFEFLAIDRPLEAVEQAKLRALSTRARITATSFVNHYDWGNFGGNPRRLMERYFDIFLYFANWGARHFSIRLPARLIDVQALQRFCPNNEVADVRIVDAHAIVDIWRDEVEVDIWRDEVEYEDWEIDGNGQLAALTPLRGDLMQGDLRVFYLVWLMAVEDGLVDDDKLEPLPGIAPLSAPLRAFANFFDIDSALVDAAAATGAAAPPPDAERADAETYIRTLSEEDKVTLLLRLHDGEPHLGAELRRLRLKATGLRPDGDRRSVGMLRDATRRIAAERTRVAREKADADRRRRDEDQARSSSRRLAMLAERGTAPWRDVEALISKRNHRSYEKATTLLTDLRDVAQSQGAEAAFARRLADIRNQHSRKERLIERLEAAGLR